MNLASRCRQALNHVESLRKELARYKKQDQGQGHLSSSSTPMGEMVPTTKVPVSSHYANEVVPRRDENRIFGRTHGSPPNYSNVNNAPQDNFERNMNVNTNRVRVTDAMTTATTVMTNNISVENHDDIMPNGGMAIQEETTGSKMMADKGYILAQEIEGHDLNVNMDLVENDLQKAIPSTPPPVTPETDEETPSPPPKDDLDEVGDFDDEEEEDITFGELRSGDFFHQTYESTLPSTPEKENIDMEAMNRKFDSFNIADQGVDGGKQKDGNAVNKQTNGMMGIDKGSFDAFEASFQTTFPTSFADGISPSSFGGTEFSDSFFMEGARSSRDSAKKIDKSPRKGRTKGGDNNDVVDPAMDMDAPMDEAMDLFPNPALTTSFEPFETPTKSSGNEVNSNSTPSVGLNSGDSPSVGSGSDRNTTNNVLSARARFERRQRKAIEQQKQAMHHVEKTPPNAPMDEAQADETGEHSPTLVLKRLKQKRQAKANSNSSASLSHSPKKVTKGISSSAKSISISEEIRKLDAIATSVSVSAPSSSSNPSSREKQRRSVSRPTSYAEPSLNSKLRRGDVFFPKENSSSLSNGNGNSNSNLNSKNHEEVSKVEKGQLSPTKTRVVSSV